MNSNQRGIITNSRQQSLPPVPARFKERIIKGEYIEFTALLPKAMLSSNVYVEPDHPGSLTLQMSSGSSELTIHPTAKGKNIYPSLPEWRHEISISQYVLITHHHVHLD